MARFVVSDVVIVPFPFSDLSDAKWRPALVLATLMGNDLILCQITSQGAIDGCAVEVGPEKLWLVIDQVTTIIQGN